MTKTTKNIKANNSKAPPGMPSGIPPVRPIRRDLSPERTNVVRRKQYATDLAYRRETLARSREYRESRRQERAKTSYHTLLRNRVVNHEVGKWAQVRKFANGKLPPAPCLAMGELAGAINRTPDTIKGWIEGGYILKPDMAMLTHTGKPLAAYSVARAERIVLAISQVIASDRGQLRDWNRPRMQKLMGIKSK